MRQCQTCGRPVEGSAATCDACSSWAAGLVEPPSAEDAAAGNREAAAPVTGATSLRRDMLLAAAGVAGAALITFAVLLTRSVPSPTLSAAAGTGTAPSGTPLDDSSPAVTQSWSTENQAHWLGQRGRGAAFELPADNVVQTWLGPARPSLVVRCMSRSVETFVHTASPLMIEPNAEGKTVSMSLDDEPMATERWQDAEDRTALFAPNGAAFSQRLRNARILKFGYTPHNARAVVARFHVTGLAPLMDRFAKECGSGK